MTPSSNFLWCIYIFNHCRISVENIEGEFSSLYVKTRSLEQKIHDDDELQKQLEPFLQVNESFPQLKFHSRVCFFVVVFLY